MSESYIKPPFNFLDEERTYLKKILQMIFNHHVKSIVPVKIIIDYLFSNSIYPENLLRYEDQLLQIKIAFASQKTNCIETCCPYCGSIHKHGIPKNRINFHHSNCGKEYIIVIDNSVDIADKNAMDINE